MLNKGLRPSILPDCRVNPLADLIFSLHRQNTQLKWLPDLDSNQGPFD